jgi:signal transduction histidine kinase
MEIIAEHLGSAIQAARLHAQARQAAVMRERHQLARELHDNVTQLLTSVNLIGQSLTTAWARDPAEGERRTIRLQDLVRQSLQEMRALMQELGPGPSAERSYPQSDDLVARDQLRRDGLAATLDRLLQLSAPETLKLRIDFGSYTAQAIELEETLLRIAQEAISNAIRHARASRLSLSAAVTGNTVELIIADNGRGIDPKARHGLGLQNMRDRAVEGGGRLQLQAAHPSGTRVIARMPVRPASGPSR